MTDLKMRTKALLLAKGFWEEVKSFWQNITIEPNVFLHVCSFSIISGAAVHTNLMLWKVCAVVKGYDEAICDGIESSENEEVKKDVQRWLNDFNIFGGFIGAIPGIAYSLFVGALSDRYGRRPMIYLPMLGWTISSIINCSHYAYIW